MSVTSETSLSTPSSSSSSSPSPSSETNTGSIELVNNEGEINRNAIAFRIIPQILRKLTIKAQNYVRYTAYTSEVGEASRPYTTKTFVNIMYGLSFGYVFADVGFKCHKHYLKYGKENIYYLASDQLMWHSMASLAFPSLIIHQLVHYSQSYMVPYLNKYTKPKFAKFCPLVLGLGSIPLIIHPIDVAADFVMNNTVRKYIWGDKIDIISHSETKHD